MVGTAGCYGTKELRMLGAQSLGLLLCLSCASALTVEPSGPKPPSSSAPRPLKLSSSQHPQFLSPSAPHSLRTLKTQRRLTLSGGSPLESQSSDALGEHYSSETEISERGYASSSDLEESVTLKEVPDLRKLLKFLIPTFGVFLANPIMSLMDTAAVGQFCTKEQLAALGPATSACDMLVFMTNFMPVATTTLLAQAMAKMDSEGARRVLHSAYTISAVIGSLMFMGLLFGGSAVLRLFLGSSGDAQQLLPYALRYSIWRGIGLPATVLGMSAQAACIACKDSQSPFFSVLMQAAANTVLDFLLVGVIDGGVTGAALATTIAQVMATTFLLGRVERNMQKFEEKTEALKSEASNGEMPLKRTSSSMEFPSMDEVIKFWSFAGPIFLITFGRSYCWSILTPGAASAGTVALAAHQIIINVFFLFSIAGHAVFQTVQAFMPEHQEEQKRTKKLGGEIHKQATANVRSLASKLLLVAAAVGIVQMFVSLVPTLLLPGVFCRDSEIIAAVRKEAYHLAWSILPHTTVLACEALLINGKDTDFLGINYIAFCLVWTWAVRSISRNYKDLSVLWRAMIAYAWGRGLSFAGRLMFSGARMGIPVFS